MPEGSSGEITQLLGQMREGNPDAAARLMPLVYKDLRRRAAALMKRERPGHTLQPTAVVHEAYVRLAGSGLAAENRAHFFGIAARAMRQVLVDHARQKLADKRGGLQQRVELDDDLGLTEKQSAEVLAIHEALDKLAKVDQRQAEIMEMFYFVGDSVDELAERFDCSTRQIKRELQTGRLFLKEQLQSSGFQTP